LMYRSQSIFCCQVSFLLPFFILLDFVYHRILTSAKSRARSFLAAMAFRVLL
jgi:hypothetical protein